MKTLKTFSAILILLSIISGVNSNASAQTYYAVFAAEEKEEGGSASIVQRLILTNVFEITSCPQGTQLSNSIYDVRSSRVLESQIRKAFEEDYEAYYSRRGYYVNLHYSNLYYFETYEQANSKRKEILGKYRNGNNLPKDGIKEMSLKIPCR